MDQDPKNKPGGASNNYNIAIVSVKSSPSHVYMIKGKNAALDPRAHRPLIAILVVISLPASSSFVGTKAWMGTRNLPGFWGMPLAKQETQQVGSSLEFSRKRRSPFSTGPCMNFDNDLASLQEGKESLSPDYATHIPMPSTAGNAANSRGFVGGCKAGSEPTFNDVLLAKERLKGNVKMTDCSKHEGLSKKTGVNLYFKKEYQQYTGAFKERGARNTLQNLLEEYQLQGKHLKDKGVVAASAGNHALGLAYHGGKMGIPITVIMPLGASMTKVNRCKDMGANVVQHGNNFGEAKRFAMTSEDFVGIPYIDPFNDPSVIAGAGTIGLEILDQMPNVDAVVVPIGGGGLIAGISMAIKTHRPDVMIIGVEPENAPSMTAAFREGNPVEVDVECTVADGLSVPKVGQTSYDVARKYVDKVVTVPEGLIPLAILRLVEMERAVIEGAGAIGLAAFLPGGALEGLFAGKNVCTVLSGGNIDSTTLGRIIDRGLAADRRLIRFQLLVKDSPGHLMKLTSVIAGAGANVKDIFHDRAWTPGSICMLTMTCTVELGGPEHEQMLKQALSQHKYKVLQWPQ